MIERDTLYLTKRKNGYYYYQRKVPENLVEILGYKLIRKSLKTKDLKIAQIRRDALVEADDAYWSGICKVRSDEISNLNEIYKRAVEKASSLGFAYKTVDDLLNSPIDDIVSRLEALDRNRSSNGKIVPDVAEAVLGGAGELDVSITEAFKIYCNDIMAIELSSKSEGQKKSWKKVKLRAVNNFISLRGNKDIAAIDRDDGIAFHNFWQKRILSEGLSNSSGNRDLGNMRRLYSDYFTHIGEKDRFNPFSNLSFKKKKGSKKKVKPFETHFLRSRVVPDILNADLLVDIKRIFLATVETGCRPSEICNLHADNIFLSAPIPFIRVEFMEEMEVKTETSVRDIPLMGISLLAIRNAPEGFPRYYDKSTGYSNAIMKVLKRLDLLPSEFHRAYSVRHSFEERMKEAGIDYELRCILMGHKLDRAEYGTGGSLEYRFNEMKKFVFDVQDGAEKLLAG